MNFLLFSCAKPTAKAILRCIFMRINETLRLFALTMSTIQRNKNLTSNLTNKFLFLQMFTGPKMYKLTIVIFTFTAHAPCTQIKRESIQ